MQFAAEEKIPYGETLSQKPTKCDKCDCKEFRDLSNCWKCNSCGKNYGKIKARIISKAWNPTSQNEWFTKNEAEVI